MKLELALVKMPLLYPEPTFLWAGGHKENSLILVAQI